MKITAPDHLPGPVNVPALCIPDVLEPDVPGSYVQYAVDPGETVDVDTTKVAPVDVASLILQGWTPEDREAEDVLAELAELADAGIDQFLADLLWPINADAAAPVDLFEQSAPKPKKSRKKKPAAEAVLEIDPDSPIKGEIGTRPDDAHPGEAIEPFTDDKAGA